MLPITSHHLVRVIHEERIAAIERSRRGDAFVEYLAYEVAARLRRLVAFLVKRVKSVNTHEQKSSAGAAAPDRRAARLVGAAQGAEEADDTCYAVCE